jgi:class 3 adenylate cyclase
VSLGEELNAEVSKILGYKDNWSVREGQKVPETADIALGSEAVRLDATILYADLADSTLLVDGHKWWFSAEIYKSYLYCAARVIRNEGGVITAYDGDRVMAVFIGDAKNSDAAKTAIKIHYAVRNIVNPLVQEKYPKSSYRVGHVVGIDSSEVHVARTGVRGSNDLVWIGRAANYAAKLSARPETYRTYVTKEVYKKLNKDSKLSNGADMWTPVTWSEFDSRTIYGSNYWWKFT